MFSCRLSLALGILPSEVGQIGSNDFDLLYLYWRKEPWGPYRDNLHAAILAREVRRPHSRSPVKLADFMVTDPYERQAAETKGIFAMLKTMATRRKKAK